MKRNLRLFEWQAHRLAAQDKEAKLNVSVVLQYKISIMYEISG